MILSMLSKITILFDIRSMLWLTCNHVMMYFKKNWTSWLESLPVLLIYILANFADLDLEWIHIILKGHQFQFNFIGHVNFMSPD
jgi:hypothetical protein